MATSQPTLFLIWILMISTMASGSWMRVPPEATGSITQTPTDQVASTLIKAVPTIIPTATTTPLVEPVSESDNQSLMDFCSRGQSDSEFWRSRLNQITFQTDVSDEVQSQLPSPVRVVPSCNYEMDNVPRAIVLHYTEGQLEAAISTFQKANNTSAHYIIDRDGTIIQVVPETFVAYHVSCYGVRSYCLPSCPICDDEDGNLIEPRTQSIGIELVNLGHVNPDFFSGQIIEDFNVSFGYRYWEVYPEVQILALHLLINDVRTRWDIPSDMVFGHSRINNNTDPGPALILTP
jgi:N-acetylmuramoyl-L-alanine amidase